MILPKLKKNICVVITNRASYGRIKYLLISLKKNIKVNLQIVIGGSLLLYEFGKASDIIEKDGFKIDKKINFNVSGSDLSSQSKSTGLAIIELTNVFNDLKPDAVITFADRYETMATAITASYMNIYLIHIQGGELSGNIDDRVRHSISKLADYHFPSTLLSKKRLIAMGESPKRISCFGCPSIDLINNNSLDISNHIMKKYGGTGGKIDWSKKFILVLLHPVTTSYGMAHLQMTNTLKAIKDIEYQKVILWPNIDAGSSDTSKAIREFKEKNNDDKFFFFRNFEPEDYLRLLSNTLCAVGNSSSFIREGSKLGTPAVLIGDRQKNRETGKNIVITDYNYKNISKAINKQIKNGKYNPTYIFGKGDISKKISAQIDKLNFRNRK